MEKNSLICFPNQCHTQIMLVNPHSPCSCSLQAFTRNSSVHSVNPMVKSALKKGKINSWQEVLEFSAGEVLILLHHSHIDQVAIRGPSHPFFPHHYLVIMQALPRHRLMTHDYAKQEFSAGQYGPSLFSFKACPQCLRINIWVCWWYSTISGSSSHILTYFIKTLIKSKFATLLSLSITKGNGWPKINSSVIY